MRLTSLFLVILLGCAFTKLPSSSIAVSEGVDFRQFTLVDQKATRKTKVLYANLKHLSREHILFGHQDDLAYGVMWKESKNRRSDVRDVAGSYPAVFGWDLSKLGKWSYNIDTVDFSDMRDWMIDAYQMGGINTISWHVDNFMTGGDSWDTSENVVATILPGGVHHSAYKAKLDVLADFFKSLKTGLFAKHPIPVIFRPFHEHTGSWFWWGQPHCSPEQYKELWQFTVQYLRDVKEVHNLLYCYSPDIFKDKAHYLECYPGDAFVDVLGLDDYHDVNPENDPEALTQRLRMLVELADTHGKVAALTETGLDGIPESDWWTERLLRHIKSDPVASRIAWVLVWRNARPSHHFAPYLEHVSAENFKDFCEDPLILMERNLPKMYRANEIVRLQRKEKSLAGSR
ncbi:MAG: beta-mannosidase [Phaeodactylibacter sp.]|nr:beta-mannosidase [Phaeodactylibacter sp.]